MHMCAPASSRGRMYGALAEQRARGRKFAYRTVARASKRGVLARAVRGMRPPAALSQQLDFGLGRGPVRSQDRQVARTVRSLGCVTVASSPAFPGATRLCPAPRGAAPTPLACPGNTGE